MVTHIVFWELKESAEGHSKRENAEHIKEMLEKLVGVIPGLIDAEVGINENGGKYDAVLCSHFESYAALKAYDTHPEHLKVRAFVKAVRESRESIDFEQ